MPKIDQTPGPDDEFVLTHAILQSQAEERVADAKALFACERWAFAYYVAGYAVECALKACVLSRMVRTGLVFKRNPPNCRTHDLVELARLAGLAEDLNAKLKEGGSFPANWGTVKLWKETSRYESRDKGAAEALIQAIEGVEGVLPWLKTYWLPHA